MKRSISTMSDGRPSLNKQASVMSQDFHFEVNELARISLEDVPTIGMPSPYPGRASFPGDDTVSIASSHKVRMWVSSCTREWQVWVCLAARGSGMCGCV